MIVDWLTDWYTWAVAAVVFAGLELLKRLRRRSNHGDVSV